MRKRRSTRLPISRAFAAWLQVGQLAFNLWRRGQFRADHRLLNRAPRILAATAAMAATVWLALQYADPATAYFFNRRWIVVIAIAIGGVALYGAGLIALGGVRLSDYKAYSRNRKSF